MTDAPEPTIAAVMAALDAIDDPAERFQASKTRETEFDAGIKGVRQRIALELKHQHGKTWREVGEIMGDVTAQRAEQISRGV